MRRDFPPLPPARDRPRRTVIKFIEVRARTMRSNRFRAAFFGRGVNVYVQLTKKLCGRNESFSRVPLPPPRTGRYTWTVEPRRLSRTTCVQHSSVGVVQHRREIYRRTEYRWNAPLHPPEGHTYTRRPGVHVVLNRIIRLLSRARIKRKARLVVDRCTTAPLRLPRNLG